jgi:accessory colonization factor AcfC
METLIIKVDNKKNLAYLKELLLKFNFVVEIDADSHSEKNQLTGYQNVAGRLSSFSDVKKLKEEETIWEKVVKEKHGVH